ncbi:hypothetical protein ACFLV4_05850 [Chloroflexota bacterium]
MDRDRIGIKRSPKDMSELKEIFFDLETKLWSTEVEGGFSNISAFGMSVAVTWNDGHGFQTWLEKDATDLVAELVRADRVIGFNNVSFDYEVLSAYVPNVHAFLDVKSFDILADVYGRLGFRVSLDNICSATFSKGKSASPEDALRWYRQGEIDKVVFYCQTDVELTRELYRFGQEHGFICYPQLGQLVELPVDWGTEVR